MYLPNSPEIIDFFNAGAVFAYPTEAVYGLGCDPANAQAVAKLFELKLRPREKGVILIADHWDKVESYVDTERLEPATLTAVLDSWPSFTTYLLPKSKGAPRWITGDSPYVAIRLTSHPVVCALCTTVNSALISTSANLSGREAVKNPRELQATFGQRVIYIAGELGGENKPSAIYNAVTGELIRGDKAAK